MSSKLLIISADEIRQLATMERLLGWMETAMQLTSKRDIVLPLRRALELPEDMGMVGIMPGYLGGNINAAGVKLVSLVPPHRRKGSSHLGLMVLYDADGLLPISIMCGSTVTAIRTSAVSALATNALAKQNSSTLAILGTGEQAEAHAVSMSHVRDFNKMIVWGHNKESVKKYQKRMHDLHGYTFEVASNVAAAVQDADVICTTTSATKPFLFGDMVKPGVHINLVGSSHKGAAEVDGSLVQKSRFFIDYLPSIMDQAAEFLRAVGDGLIGENHIVGEIGAVLNDVVEGRVSDSDITVYKSVGVAAQDIICAKHVYELARAQDKGIAVTI